VAFSLFLTSALAAGGSFSLILHYWLGVVGLRTHHHD
jgi:hypothetical protein